MVLRVLLWFAIQCCNRDETERIVTRPNHQCTEFGVRQWWLKVARRAINLFDMIALGRLPSRGVLVVVGK